MRRITMLLTAALVMAAMAFAMAMPAFASTPEDPVGGGGGMCDVIADPNTGYNTGSCQGGGGVNQPGEPGTNGYPTGGGGHGTQDSATGDGTISGGSGGLRTSYDENGQPIRDPGGGGYHCEIQDFGAEADCVGTGF